MKAKKCYSGSSVKDLFHHLFKQGRDVTFEEYLVHILKHFEQNQDSIATLLLSTIPIFYYALEVN